MSKCPDCKSLLRGATRCACGWREPASHAFIVASESAAAERNREEEAARMDRWIAAGRPSAAKSLARMKRIESQPKPTPAEHWRRVASMKNPPAMAYQHAIAYLTRIGEYTEREPGQDDDEREAA